jgi:hypothetical protein
VEEVAINLQAILSINRNDPCPCGSGKKYKRCCQSAVEESTRAIALDLVQPEDFVFPQLGAFITALGFACGLTPDTDEEPPTPAALVPVAKELLDALQSEEDQEKLRAVHRELASFLKETSLGRKLRFDYQKFREVWEDVTEFTYDEDLTEEEEVELAEEALKRLVTPEFVSDTVIKLLVCLRSREVTPEERLPLLWGLWSALEKHVTDSLLWRVLLVLAVAEEEAGRRAMRDFLEKHSLSPVSEEGEEYMQDLREILDQHPSMEAMLSEKVWPQLVPVLRAVTDGTIPFAVPPYTVVNTLADIYLIAQRPAAGRSILSYLETGPLFDLVSENAWERDYEVFRSAAAKVLLDWRAAHADDEPELAAAVENLCSSLGSNLLRAEKRAFEFLYFLALSNILSSAGEEAVLGPDGLTAYAAELDQSGQSEAAAHIRAAAERMQQTLS